MGVFSQLIFDSYCNSNNLWSTLNLDTSTFGRNFFFCQTNLRFFVQIRDNLKTLKSFSVKLASKIHVFTRCIVLTRARVLEHCLDQPVFFF